ncbi:MAG: PHP domain-containing protein [Actinomycetota bacterium]|nr:PHP domain-containing protein [Actinomycetota bacterium]
MERRLDHIEKWMEPMGDYHVHLHPHGDPVPGSPEPGTFPRDHIERYVEAAAARGVEEICFTEHLFRMRDSELVLGDFWRDESDTVAAHTIGMIETERNMNLDEYAAAVIDAKDSGLPVLLGLEVDYFPETIDAALDLLAPYPWDLIVGGVHWIGGFAFDHEEMISEFNRRGADQVFEAYYDLETRLAASGAVDVLAHADLVKKHGHHSALDPSEVYVNLARAAAASGTLVEVSSAGLNEVCKEIYPSPALLSAFHDEGVGMTMASDTHLPAGSGWGLDVVADRASKAGYTQRAIFSQRRHHPVSFAGPDDSAEGVRPGPTRTTSP